MNNLELQKTAIYYIILGIWLHKHIFQTANNWYIFHEQKLWDTFGMELLDINLIIPLLYLSEMV